MGLSAELSKTNNGRCYALVKFLQDFSGQGHPSYSAFAPQPNESFNADANIGHRFAILMANVGALRASRSGAG
jgi:hypothetical protein